MVWCNDTSKRPRSTYETSSHPTPGTRAPHPPFFQSIHSRLYGLHPGYPTVRERTPTVLRPAVLGIPQHGITHNWSCGKFSGPPKRHPQLWPPTPEARQWPDENSIRQTGQLRGLPRQRQSVALFSTLHEAEIAQAPTSGEGPWEPSTGEGEANHIRHNPPEKINGGTPLGYSGRIFLRREQCGMQTRC
jgi:hypothetical protein